MSNNNNNGNNMRLQPNVIAALMIKYVDPADQSMLQQVSGKLKFFQEQMASNMTNGDIVKNQQLMMQYQQLQQQQGHLMYKIQQQIQNGKIRESMESNKGANGKTGDINNNSNSNGNDNSNDYSNGNSNLGTAVNNDMNVNNVTKNDQNNLTVSNSNDSMDSDNSKNNFNGKRNDIGRIQQNANDTNDQKIKNHNVTSPFQQSKQYFQQPNHSAPANSSPNMIVPNSAIHAINDHNGLISGSKGNSFDVKMSNKAKSSDNIPANIDIAAANNLGTSMLPSGVGSPMVSSVIRTPTSASHIGTPRSNIGTPLTQPGNLQKINMNNNTIKPGDSMTQMNSIPQKLPSVLQQQQYQQQGIFQQQSSMDLKKKASLQLQTELFMKTLVDFLGSKHIALDPQKVIIDNKVISMFLLYFFVNKLGGLQAVTNSNQWELVARRLNLITLANEGNVEMFAMRLFQCYKEYLADFDIFLKTPEGQKQLDLNKKQKLLEIQQRAKMNPAMFSMISGQQKQPQQPQQPMMNQKKPTTPLNHPQQLDNLPLMATMQASPATITMTQQQLPKQMIMRNATIQSNGASVQRNTPSLINTNISVSQIQHKLPKKNKSASDLGATNDNVAAQSASPTINLPKQTMSATKSAISHEQSKTQLLPKLIVTKKYDPIIRQIQTHAGYDIKKLVIDGEQLESVKPNYLFPPEGGLINIHALTMALNSGSLSEVNNVLNMLLVTSLDPKLFFDFNECKELLDRICEVGLTILDELLHFFESDDALNVDIYHERLKEKKNKKPEKGRGLFKNKFVEIQEEYDIYDKYYREKVDCDVVSAKKRKFHEIEMNVDGFTGEEINQNHMNNQEEYFAENLFSPEEFYDKLFAKSRPEKNIEKLGIPLYVDLLVKTNDEMCDIFSEMNTRASENYQIMLVDQLVIITMILRNVCFYAPNQQLLCDSKDLHSFIFKLLHSVFGRDELFVYLRRKLSILKNILTILMNISHLFKLKSFDEAAFIVFLVLEFGGDPIRCNDKVIMDYQEMLHKMTSIAVDMFTKLLANCKENRFLVKCVLTGRYTQTSSQQQCSSFLQNSFKKYNNIILDNDLDIEEEFSEALYGKFGILKNTINNSLSAYQLSKLFIEHETHDSVNPESGYLFERIFSLLISVVPLTAPNASIIASMVKQRAALLLQALFSLNLLCKMVPLQGEMSLAMKWLSTSENLGSSLLRISFICGLSKDQSPVLLNVAVQSLQLCSSLIYMTVKFIESNDSEEAKNDLKQLSQIPKLFPTEDNIFAIMVAPNSDPRIIDEILKLSQYKEKIMDAFAKAQNRSEPR